jgi:hypothetical protein
VLVDDLESHVAHRPAAGLTFSNDSVKGVGGSRAPLDDSSGNRAELLRGPNLADTATGAVLTIERNTQ